MHIDRIELREVRLPLVHPFETSFGRETEQRVVIVRIDAGKLTGWGESAAGIGPWYSYETVETCWHVQRDFLAPLLLGQEVESPRETSARFASIRGHNMAKTGPEAAIWDLFAKAADVPLARLLGGEKDRIESGVSVGIQESIDDLLGRISAFVDRGYRRIKIKIKPGWDVDTAAAVRERFPDLPLMLDANSAYALEDAELFRRLDRFDLMMVEQPLGHDDIVDHAKLQAQIETAVCLDESIVTPEHARWAIELGSCRIINIKPGRVGGLGAAVTIHDLCAAHGLPVWCGGLLETGIGRAHNVAVSSLPNFRLPGDVSESARYYERDLVDPPFGLNPDGTITVPTGPGIGVEVDEEWLDTRTVRRMTIER
jgi:O-succinylbenzoate synthase